MIQQLRLQFASPTPPAKAAEDPACVSDFADWMADDSTDAFDPDMLLPEAAAICTSILPAPPQAEPVAEMPLRASTDWQTPIALAESVPIAVTGRDQPDFDGQLGADAPKQALVAQISRAPPERGSQSDPAPAAPPPKQQGAVQVSDGAMAVSALPRALPKADAAEGEVKLVSDHPFVPEDKMSPQRSVPRQDLPENLQLAAPTQSLETPLVATGIQMLQGPLLPPNRREAVSIQSRQAEAMPVAPLLFAAVPPDVEEPPLQKPALAPFRGEISKAGQAADRSDQDIAAPRPETLQSLPAERLAGVVAEPLRPHLTAPPNLHIQLLHHASAAIDRQVEVLLTPEELGSVKFQIRHHGDTVSILLSAERGDTMDMLRRHGDELMREFRQAGFSGATLDFGRWGQHSQSQQQAPAGFVPGEEFAVLPPIQRPDPPAPAAGDALGLNLRL